MPNEQEPKYITGTMAVAGVVALDDHSADSSVLRVLPRNSKVTVVLGPRAFNDVSPSDKVDAQIAMDEARMYMTSTEEPIDPYPIREQLCEIVASVRKIILVHGEKHTRRMDIAFNGIHIRITRPTT